jgi:hypothetical protein
MVFSELRRDVVITQNQAVICILVGTGATLVGAFNKTFYAAKGLYGAPSSNKRIPTWQGRLTFLLVGGAFLFFGIYYFISKDISE